MAERTADARTRLQTAALELFGERGFEGTTAAEIAARAGVTERTFFRHFPDKREVLFGREAAVKTALLGFVAAAPAGLGPLRTLEWAFRAMRPMVEDSWAYAKPRRVVIAGTPALQEREVAKTEVMAEALAEALRARGVAALPAELAARAGLAAFGRAFNDWLDDPARDVGSRMDLAFNELRAILA